MDWEFTYERLQEISNNPREAMIGRQEAQRLVDHYLDCQLAHLIPKPTKVEAMLEQLRSENNGL